MVEYMVAAGGNVGRLFSDVVANPQAIALLVVLLVVVVWFTTKG